MERSAVFSDKHTLPKSNLTTCDCRAGLIRRVYIPRLHLQPFGCIMSFEVMKRDVFQAIADPTRRAIIALVAMQAMTPNALAEHFSTTRQAVSKHLRILTECELVHQEQRGREIYYSLEIDKMKEIDTWLEHYRKIWESRYEQLDALLAELKQQEKKERKK